MKTLLLSLVCFAYINSGHAQDQPKLELTKEGVKPIVIQVDSFSAVTLYKKTIDWVQMNYKNPKEVLKGNIENESIRLDGLKKDAFFLKTLGMKYSYDMDYSLKIDFKDGKIRVEYSPGQVWVDNQKAQFSVNSFFKESGEIKSSFKDVKPSLEESMNHLINSLVDFIKKKPDNW